MNFNAMANAYSSVKRNARMYAAFVADPAARTDHRVRANLRMLANVGIFADHRIRTHRSCCRHARQRRDDGRRMNASRDRRTVAQERRGLRECKLRLLHAQDSL